MFFSAELLSKRDSGFGLLWLAATLGSKSSFKKLPRRSIQTADIPQLCDLISHPSEPLALRLSSNLMVGVARVYKIKHEIFVTDISNCHALLKRTLQELYALGTVSEAQLEMGHPTVRPDVLNLSADPTIAVGFDLDQFEIGWLDVSGASQRLRVDEDDEDFTLNGNKTKGKGKGKQSLVHSETGRAARHTLEEDHEYLLSTSFEGNASFGGIGPSSSQIDPGMNFGSYAFDDNLFGNDHLDLGPDLGLDIGDDLARELGEGWGVDIQNLPADAMEVGLQADVPMGDDSNFVFDNVLDNVNGTTSRAASEAEEVRQKGNVNGRKRPLADSDKENLPPSSLQGSAAAQDYTPMDGIVADAFGAEDPLLVPELEEAAEAKPRKHKKVRILLDVRTELTDEELKAARVRYVEEQRTMKEDMERKQYEKDGGKIIEDMIWAVPNTFIAPALTAFWTERYKIQVESRTGAVHLPERLESPTKRRRLDSEGGNLYEAQTGEEYGGFIPDGYDMPFDFGMHDGDYMPTADFQEDPGRTRSSEEPERMRGAAARPSSFLGFDAEALNPSSGTQRSAFFPWDNAAGTSSTAGAAFSRPNDSDRVSIENADVRIRGPRSSHSGAGSRRSSIIPSQLGSAAGISLRLSPGAPGSYIGSAIAGDDFQFDVPNEGPAATAQDTQETENNFVTLERTSYNFLEYCKMQLQTLPGNQKSLNFDDVVPPTTSSRRVAAAAFHHCLANLRHRATHGLFGNSSVKISDLVSEVLATKDLVKVDQTRAYGSLTINIK